MSEAMTLLVGGTKVLERELQTALPAAPLTSVATMEEAATILGKQAVALVVLGPTLRRALAMVATLRREGQTSPRLMVVYRDDQREEVKRHQKGRAVADSYIAQSRIQKEVAAAIAAMASGTANPAGDDDLEELDDVTMMLDVVPAQAEVLGAFDASALPAEELESLEGDLIEELAEDDAEMLELDALEVVADDEVAAGTATDLVAVELVEEIEPIELADEAVVEVVEELEVEELVEEAPKAAAQATAVAAAAAPTAAPAPVQPAPAPVHAARPAAATPAATAAPRPPSGAHAMLGELSSFVEKLQDAAQTIARLEADNDELRAKLATAEEAARAAAGLAALRDEVGDLQLRLSAAEQARSAAVEARMRADQLSTQRDEELANLRNQLATVQGAHDSHRRAVAAAVAAAQQALAALRDPAAN